jgi:ferredoxin
MSTWGLVRCGTPKNAAFSIQRSATTPALNPTRSRSYTSARAFSSSSICRQHENEIRARKSLIRTHIQTLSLSRHRHPHPRHNPRNHQPSGSISRSFSTTPSKQHGHITPPKPGQELHVTFIDKDSDTHNFEVAEGDNLLDIAQANDLEMEGACGGSCACSTCHVIVQGEEAYEKIPEADDDENGLSSPITKQNHFPWVLRFGVRLF